MQLTGQKRQHLGKKAQILREDNLLPGVIFGKDLESLPITVNYNDFVNVFKEVGETNVLDLMIDGKKHPVLVKDIHFHHITYKPIHVGFYQVNLKEKTRANIPVEVVNEEKNPLVKSEEAIVLVLLNEIKVEALPTDLPNRFVVDALELPDMDSAVLISDLDYDKEKVEVVDLDPDEIVVKLDYAQMLEEEEEEEIDEAEAIADIEATEEKEEGEEGEPSGEPREETQEQEDTSQE